MQIIECQLITFLWPVGSLDCEILSLYLAENDYFSRSTSQSGTSESENKYLYRSEFYGCELVFFMDQSINVMTFDLINCQSTAQ